MADANDVTEVTESTDSNTTDNKDNTTDATETNTTDDYESILTSVKKILGIDKEYDHFDPELIMHINTVLSGLVQIGVGESFSIKDESAKWTDFIGEAENLELVKSYIGLKVKMLFDPPQSSNVSTAIEKSISELEWRISVTVDPGDTGEE